MIEVGYDFYLAPNEAARLKIIFPCVFEVISGRFDVALYDTAGGSLGSQRLSPSFGTSASSLHRFSYMPSATWSPFEAFSESSLKALGEPGVTPGWRHTLLLLGRQHSSLCNCFYCVCVCP